MLANQRVPRAIIDLVASASERKYQNIYARARELHGLLQRGEVPGADLGAVAGVLLEKYICERSIWERVEFTHTTHTAVTFRWNTFALISKAFASIPVPVVQQYLGWSANEVLSGMC